jgi:replication initiation protein RepC
LADYATQLMGLSQGLLRTFEPPELAARRDALRALYGAVANSLENITKSHKLDANESHNGRHNQNSNSDPISSEPASGEGGGTTGPAPPPPSRTPKAYPLGMVLDACPAIADWTPAPIRDWPEFIRAATVVRSALGVSPSAWEDAVAAMGQPEAAVCVVAILQRAEAIKSPGGYLRALTEKARAGRFSLGPVLMALLRAKLKRRMAGAEIPSPRRRA